MASKLPAPIQALVAGINPKRVAMNVAPVLGGAIVAELGGALLKQIDAVEDFANGGDYNEAAVDLAGGLILDVGIIAAIGAAKGAPMAKQVAPLLVVGTILGAATPIIAPMISKAIKDGIDMLFGADAKTDKALPQAAEKATAQLTGKTPTRTAKAGANNRGSSQVLNMVRTKAGGLYEVTAGGLYDHAGF